jgi:hypothetical protein
MAILLGAGAAVFRALRRKNVDLIVRDRMRAPRRRVEGPQHIFFCVVDHFEPFWKNDDPGVAVDRVRRWRDAYPRIAERHRDRGGQMPRHAFFYPEEDYARAPECVALLAEIARLGAGDVEVHLHHDHDTADAMRVRLEAYTRALRREHGLLHGGNDRPLFAFIHGNWVLGNSGRSGAGCGVDNELDVLDAAGCYADFTLPSAPHPSQPPVMNRIYYAAGDRSRPRAHFQARDARPGTPGAKGPLIIPGPLALRRRGLLPAVENGDVTGYNPPSAERLDTWVRTGVGVADFPRWIFVKVHTHGAQERNSGTLLGDGAGSLDALFRDLLARYNDGTRHVLHFSTPWEMYRAVRAIEAGDAASIEAIEQFRFAF